MTNFLLTLFSNILMSVMQSDLFQLVSTLLMFAIGLACVQMIKKSVI